jgi:phosphatidate cytidylyltransferase
MLRTRLWMGACLIALTLAMLVFDQSLGPWYPFLALFCVVVASVATFETVALVGADRLPPRWFCVSCVMFVLLANWPAHVLPSSLDPLHFLLGAFVTVILVAFLVEMYRYREPGGAVQRLALVTWTTAYLGLLPCFLVQLRWLGSVSGEEWRGVAAVAFALFVPKVCDIGAYFTGKALGRHRMTPILSPGKTWEGLAGGLIVAALFTVLCNRRWPALCESDLKAAGFGLTVGLAGVLGDLAESFLKRDCGQKDASQAVPGFGGVLDVIDSVIFAAPVAYVWLALPLAA